MEIIASYENSGGGFSMKESHNEQVSSVVMRRLRSYYAAPGSLLHYEYMPRSSPTIATCPLMKTHEFCCFSTEVTKMLLFQPRTLPIVTINGEISNIYLFSASGLCQILLDRRGTSRTEKVFISDHSKPC